MGNARKSAVARYGGNKATYLRMEIEKVGDSDFECLISGSDNYEDKINQVEIPHERTKKRTDALTEEEQAILRSELWGIMRISRIARSGAIYDAAEAAQTFTECRIADFQNETESIPNTDGGGIRRK